MTGTPRRPYVWLDDHQRRGRIEAAARRAYPRLKYRRRQRPGGPVHIYELDLPLPGYETRHVMITFEHQHVYTPHIYADGPSDTSASPHRYSDHGRTRLCIWRPGDPTTRRWVPNDSLLALVGMIAEHLFKEGWWREHGQWLGDEAPHGPLSPEDGREVS